MFQCRRNLRTIQKPFAESAEVAKITPTQADKVVKYSFEVQLGFKANPIMSALSVVKERTHHQLEDKMEDSTFIALPKELCF